MKNKCLCCGKECSGKKCKECFLKEVSKSFEFNNYKFKSQKDLDNAIKTNLKFIPYNVEIVDDFLLSVINNLHEDVKRRKLKCSKIKVLDWNGQIGKFEFCRNRFRGGIFVTGFFEPINEWHGVTLYPYKRSSNKIKNKLKLCLRQKWSEQAEQREPNAKCEICGASKPQLHHDNITFNEIVNNCLSYFSDEELKNGIGDDWWWHESESDAIPNNHPAVTHMLELHKNVKYKWICWECHKKTFADNFKHSGDTNDYGD